MTPPSERNSSPFQAYSPYPGGNPFKVEGITERWVQKQATQSSMIAVDEETGETRRIYFPPVNMKVKHDGVTYAKLLRNTKVEELSVMGKVILLYIAFQMRVNREDVVLYWSHVCKWCGITKTPFYSGMRDLLNRDVIAIKSLKENTYWINPNYVFNGNRTKVFSSPGDKDCTTSPGTGAQ